MVIQRTRFVVLLALCPLLAPPAAAQNEEGFEGSPTDFLPLQVGNQWTYQHWYVNNLYIGIGIGRHVDGRHQGDRSIPGSGRVPISVASVAGSQDETSVSQFCP